MNSIKRWSVVLALLSLAVIVLAACGGGGGGTSNPATTYTISGAVLSSGTGTALQGVTMSLSSGSGTTTTITAANGVYSFSGLTNRSYTITPVKTGYAFLPLNRIVTVSGSDVPNKDFTATSAATTYSISGTISVSGGGGLFGVTTSLTGSNTATVFTNASGNYTFAGLVSGSYTVTPAFAGYTFSPVYSTVSVTSLNVSGKNFTATAVTTSGLVQVSNAKSFKASTGTQALDILAIDGSGDVWVGSQAYGSVMRIQPGTATATCTAGCTLITKPNMYLRGLAIDNMGYVWIADSPGNLGFPSSSNVALANINPTTLAVTNVYPTSAQLSGNLTLYGQAASGPLAIDNSGNIVVGGNAVFNSNGTMNYSLMLTTISGAGSVLTNFTVPAAVITDSMLPQVVAVDGSGNTWAIFTRLGGQNILVKYAVGNPGSPATYTLPGGVVPLKIAFDSTGAAWLVTSTDTLSNSPSGTGILKIAATAPSDCSSGCTGYASASYLEYPKDIAVDGADTAWVVGQVYFSSLSYNAVGVTKVTSGATTNCSTGCTAYVNSQYLNTANASAGGIAIDGSGNVWLENYADGSVVELPAIAAGTVTPIVAQPR